MVFFYHHHHHHHHHHLFDDDDDDGDDDASARVWEKNNASYLLRVLKLREMDDACCHARERKMESG